MKTPTIAAHGNINSNIPLPCMHHIFSIGIGSGIWYLDSVVMDGIDTSRQLPRKCVCPSNIERFRRAGRYIRLSVEHVLPHSFHVAKYWREMLGLIDGARRRTEVTVTTFTTLFFWTPQFPLSRRRESSIQ